MGWGARICHFVFLLPLHLKRWLSPSCLTSRVCVGDSVPAPCWSCPEIRGCMMCVWIWMCLRYWGVPRMKRREEEAAGSALGPSPRVRAPLQQQKARAVFRTQLPKCLERALLKGICWAHFWGKFPFWGSWSEGISCVGRQSFLTWRLLGRETVS